MFTLDSIVPWGRSFDEYCRMFALSADDLARKRILGCADGPAGFDLALCSHLLFLYSEQLGQTLHYQAIQELCRVAGDVRVFPLLALGGKRSPYVDVAIIAAREAGRDASVERVPYEFQRGGSEMLYIRTAD